MRHWSLSLFKYPQHILFNNRKKKSFKTCQLKRESFHSLFGSTLSFIQIYCQLRKKMSTDFTFLTLNEGRGQSNWYQWHQTVQFSDFSYPTKSGGKKGGEGAGVCECLNKVNIKGCIFSLFDLFCFNFKWNQVGFSPLNIDQTKSNECVELSDTTRAEAFAF